MDKIFVYGTLKRDGRYFSSIEKEVKFIRDDVYVRGVLISLGKYPGLIEGNGKVIGELFSITEIGLKKCNKIEGYSYYDKDKNLYYPMRKDIFSEQEIFVDSAIVYIFNTVSTYFVWQNKTAKIIVG